MYKALFFIIILLSYHNLAGAEHTYTKEKSYGFSYKEDSEGNSYIFFKNKQLVKKNEADDIRCNLLFTEKEENHKILKARKCMEANLSIEKTGYGWYILKHPSYNHETTLFFNTKNPKIETTNMGTSASILEIKKGKNGIYILSQTYPTGYSVYILETYENRKSYGHITMKNILSITNLKLSF